jgi:acetyl-CoA C-acetyltransferase
VALDPHAPVLIGSGQFLNRDGGVDPVSLMTTAVGLAASDAGLTGTPRPDTLRVVSLLSWRYGNAPQLLAEQLGIEPRDLVYTTNGGNSPQSLVNVTAGEIQRGELDLAILAGGETTRTRKRAKADGTEIIWPKAPEGSIPRVVGQDLVMNHPAEIERGIVMPVQVYPMIETALRAAAGRGIDDHLVRISELWSRFSAVAATNPHAWIRELQSAEAIRTPGPSNRMVGLPYTKMMNSNNTVDMSAALIMCSAEKAAALGVPRDRWIFVHSGADCHEHQFLSNRWSFAETPAVQLGGQAALQLAGVDIDDVAVVDLYSCFPSAVQLGAQSLGLTLDRQLTRTGGLSFAGGPWNNYVMHAIATVMNDLRQLPGESGLVWGNGGYTTKHAFGVYSTEPPADGFRHAHPQDEIDALPQRELATDDDASGEATIEAYTVMHSRDGLPERAIAALLLDDGRRSWGASTDPDVTAAMCAGEWVGRRVTADATGDLRLD